jgi:small lipoprotein (TIGR04452 family)
MQYATFNEIKGVFMRKIKIVVATIVIAFAITSCENVGLLGQGGVKGSKAKEEILSIANQNSIIIGSMLSPYLGSYTGPMIVMTIVIDGAVVPGLAGISDSAHYSRPSVNACKSKMSSVGLIIDNWIGAITCDLKKSPSILQIGDGETGNMIQLGPIGL